MRRKPEEPRSHRWLGVEGLRALGHRSRMAQIGFSDEDDAGAFTAFTRSEARKYEALVKDIGLEPM